MVSRIITWLAQIMRWVLMTALGLPVEPEVSRNFAMVSGPMASCAASRLAMQRRAQEVGEPA